MKSSLKLNINRNSEKDNIITNGGSLDGSVVKNLPAMWETWVQSLGWEYPLEKAMAPHSSTLAWKIPWMEEPGRLQSMGSLRIRHDWVSSLSVFTFLHWRRKWQSTPVFLPGELRGQKSLEGCSPWGHWGSDTTELLHFSLSGIGEGNGKPFQCSFLENPRDGGGWWAAIYGVTQSRPQLKWLSSSSSSLYIINVSLTCDFTWYRVLSKEECTILLKF